MEHTRQPMKSGVVLNLCYICSYFEFCRALKNWNKPEINKGIVNGAEIDMTIGEDFKKDDLVALLSKYAEEQEEMGGNILTGKSKITICQTACITVMCCLGCVKI